MSLISAEPIPRVNRRSTEEWVRAVRSRDRVAMEAQAELRLYLLRGLQRGIGSQARLDEATLEDFIQEAMLRITVKLDSFRGDSSFKTWAMAVAIRVAYSGLRRRRFGNQSLESLERSAGARVEPEASPTPDPFALARRDDLLRTLRQAIDDALTDRQRMAVLGQLAGTPNSEVAEQLSTNVNALYKLRHDGRRRLRLALERRGFTEGEVRSILASTSNS